MLIIATVMLCLPSCGKKQIRELMKMDEDERAVKLYELADETLNDIESYTIEMYMLVSATIENISLSVSADGEMKYSNINGDDMAYLETTTTNMTVSGSGVNENESNTAISGYYDGKMFVSNKSKDSVQKLWSPSSAEQYREYLDSKSDDDIEFEVEHFSEREAERKDDGSWKIELSGVNAEGMADMIDMLHGIDEMFGDSYELRDVEVSMRLDQKYRPESLDVSYIFEAASNKVVAAAPTVTVEAEYKDFDQTEIEAPDLSGYVETYDLAVVDKVLDGFDKLTSFEERVDFTASNLFRVNDAITGTQYSRDSYKYVGSAYYQLDDDFRYTLKMQDADVASSNAGNTMVYSYADGKQVITLGDGAIYSTNTCTDYEAKLFIEEFINCSNFSMSVVKDIAQRGENKYEFTLVSSAVDDLKSEIESTGAQVSSVTAVLTVTMNGDSIKSYVYTESLNYTLNGYDYTYTQTRQVDF